MQIKTDIPKDIRFDPAAGTFDALVTLHTEQGAHRYAVSCAGHIDMPIAFAALKLTQQAKAHHNARTGLRSSNVVARSQTAQPLPSWSHQASLPRVA